jgi:hypothetical protein
MPLYGQEIEVSPLLPPRQSRAAIAGRLGMSENIGQ